MSDWQELQNQIDSLVNRINRLERRTDTILNTLEISENDIANIYDALPQIDQTMQNHIASQDTKIQELTETITLLTQRLDELESRE